MKKIKFIYVMICFLLCLIPSAGLLVFHSENTGKEEHETLPSPVENGTINVNYLPELGSYFEDSFALRSWYIDADATIMDRVFHKSNNDSVVVGKNGWLYYSSSLDDYLGRNVLSDRGIYNIENNLSLLEEYVRSRGAEFLFTIAPNKNTLYGENMPDEYQIKMSGEKNLTKLEERLKGSSLSYCSLYDTFSQQDEVLYLKKDYHWNNKGALLAYDTLLSRMGYAHDIYETTKVIRTKTNVGDLNAMLYPATSGEKTEWNYDYQFEKNYTFEGENDEVEDDWLVTDNQKEQKSLLMFRDSFGDTLIPFFSNAFGKAYYSKAANYNIEKLMDEYAPEYVIAEKVERNISEYARTPSVMEAPKRTVDQSVIQNAESGTTVRFENSETDADYFEIAGVLDPSVVSDTSDVYVKVTDGDRSDIYEAFTLTDDESDNGYLMYLKKQNVQSTSLGIEIIVKNGDTFTSVASDTLEAR